MTCLECNNEMQGRTDKKFCDVHCRNNYNNRRRQADSETVRQINKILQRNRSILEDIYTRNETPSREKLSRAGFSFQHYTGFTKQKSGERIFRNYEYALRERQGKWLVLRQE